ncbi:MAG: alpha-E domain-containing protein [Candidatus Eremiobacteraeota bacterium]|nr:alpha-E domain-containing protein [Candidatus Eremiobacteraeota bacterium]
MLSRVAESLYWMSRYLERAENTARLLDVHLNLNMELTPTAGQRRYEDVLAALQVNFFEGQIPSATDLTLDSLLGESISNCIGAARENARQIREQISSEMFEQINKLYLYIRSRPTQDRFAIEPNFVFGRVKDGVHLFAGITDSTMTHGQGWQWIRAGRYLERANLIVGLLLNHLRHLLDENESDPQHYSELLGLLKSCTAWEAYCKVNGAELTNLQVAEFLLLSREFPHSLAFSVAETAKSLEALAQTTGMTAQVQLESKVGRLLAQLRYTSIHELFEQSPIEFFHQVREDMASVNNRLYQVYFSQSFARTL